MASSPFIETWLAGPDGHSFYTRTYPATFPKAVLLFVHGFRDHISRHEDVHAALAQRHVAVFAYDLRGFGRTALDPSNRSPGAAYSKTTRVLELSDLEFMLKHVADMYRRLPLFLMGYSAGGGLAFAFPTRTESPPSPETVALVSGVIAVSPLIELGVPPTKPMRQLVRTIMSIVPTFPLNPSFSPEKFSRDPAVVNAITSDPWIRTQGRAQAMWEMLTQGEELLETGWERWPQNMPFIMLWGTANEVNSTKAGIDLFEKINITDKKLVTYQGALDDLMHEAGDVPARFLDDCISWIDAHLERRRTPTPGSAK